MKSSDRGPLASRALASSFLSVIGFGGGQMMRLASNLILTRILSPDDFGLMALVLSFQIGLMMFSDMGLGPSIMHSERGDDPDFLDTAWSIKIVRGVILLGVATALAVPLAWFYDAPQFAQIFPVSAISLLVAGFNPTRIDTAGRHLILGRLTLVELVSQAINICLVVLAAWWLQSVWALAIGNVTGAVVLLGLSHLTLPGHLNRFRFEPAARRELMRFGKWIFLSTICGFLLFQGDRLVLGRVLTLEALGIYNIGLFLGTVPMMLGATIAGRLFIPMYRDYPSAKLPDNARVMARTRAGLSAFLILGVFLLTLAGPAMVTFLYDARYATASGLLVVIGMLQLPQIIIISYDYAALAEGNSKGLFMLQALRAVIYITLVGLGAWFYGLAGVLGGQGAAYLLAYPAGVRLARKHRVWDPRHDFIVAILALLICGLAIGMHSDEIISALRHH